MADAPSEAKAISGPAFAASLSFGGTSMVSCHSGPLTCHHPAPAGLACFVGKRQKSVAQSCDSACLPGYK